MIGNFEYCQLCKCRVDVWRAHIKSKEHQQKTKEYLKEKQRENIKQEALM